MNSAAHVVAILRDCYEMAPKDLVAAMANLLTVNTAPDANDRICFGIWSVVCGETYDLESNSLKTSSEGIRSKDIQDLLSRSELTDYGRKLLDACLDDDDD